MKEAWLKFTALIAGLLILLETPSIQGFTNDAVVYQSNCLTATGVPNRMYRGTISNDATFLYMFTMELWRLRDPKNTNIRVEATVGPEASLTCPVMFVIGQQQLVRSIELPFMYNKSVMNTYYKASRTLCIPDIIRPELRNISVRLSTCSPVRLSYTLIVSITQDYLLPLNRDVYIDVSPTMPIVRGFLFDKRINSVKVMATSKDTSCMTISIQPMECPIFDQQWNIKYVGLWQTMTKQAAMTIKHYYDEFNTGFVVVLVVHNTDEKCSKTKQNSGASLFQRSQGRQKFVTVRVSSDSKINDWILFCCLFIPVAGSFGLICLTLILFRWRHHEIMKSVQSIDVTDSYVLRKSGRVRPLESDRDESSPLNSPTTGNPTNLDEDANETTGNNDDPGENDTVFRRAMKTYPKLKPDNKVKSRVALRANVHIGDFMIQHGKQERQMSTRFCWSLITVSVFYSIPVYQLILHYLKVLYRTGEYDMCYYNYLCAYRVGYLLDFNHFYSNIGYVIFGAAFIFIVRRRSANFKIRDDVTSSQYRLSRPISALELQVKLDEEEKRKCHCCFPIIETKMGYGVPQHYGVFYALGLALIMEGLLSAAYHICPNQNNFQFDTCFMYVISILTILKVYQFRHPVALDAHQVFLILAGVVAVSVFGLLLEFWDSDSSTVFAFRITFVVCQFLLLLSFSAYFYALGYVKDESSNVITGLGIFTGLKQVWRRPCHMDRVILPFITLALCVAVVIYSEIVNADFATYLLYTFVANVLGTCLYYILIMKPLHGEFKNWSWIQPTLYFVGCGVIGGFAVTYFVQSPAQWEKSASESRSENNVECMKSWFPFQPFYDVHDVWHFYSAVALFLAFMGLLVVDDDLIATPQSRIPVF